MSLAPSLSSLTAPATRRTFLRRLAIAPALLPGLSAVSAQAASTGRVRFGLISDIHPDMLPDGRDRVRAFVAAMKDAQVDFILQLGDFCWPVQSNRPYLEAWRTAPPFGRWWSGLKRITPEGS